jgi:O-methyltransferase
MTIARRSTIARRNAVAQGTSFLASFDLLQDIASHVIAGVNPHVVHNLEKYHALKKVHYMSAMEDMPGDYLEFGVFTGSSFCHSMRCARRMQKINPAIARTRFFGFDSFAGFGALSEDDTHPFYTDTNFNTTLAKVERRARKTACDFEYQLVPGFFSESLRQGPARYGITQARIVFIDSDTYASAKDALAFCRGAVQAGTYVILDDFFSYRGAWDKGVARAFKEEYLDRGFVMRHCFNYGMGGAVYLIADRPREAA